MTPERRLKSALDAVLMDGVAAAVPGVVAAVTTPGATIYEGAFGDRRPGGDVPMTPDTIFHIASMTKAVTSLGIMQLVGRGVLDLDAPAGALVPYLREVQVLDGFDESGQPVLRPPRTPVTLRHLLTHTSGFSYDTWSHEHHRFIDATGSAPPGRGGLQVPLMFDPGTRWQYSIGYDWAGLVLEAAAGQSLGSYLQDNVFAPLGMTAGWAVPSDMHPRVAAIHQRGADGALTARTDAPPAQVDHQNGGGGIYTTAGDYLKFVRMILNRGTGNGVRIIGEDTLAEMTRADAAANNGVTPLISTDLTRSNPGEFFPGVRKRQSLGFMVNDDPAPTGRSAGSLAWAGFFNCYYWIDPAQGIGGVFLTQIVPFLDTRALPLFLAFETATYAALR